MNPNWDIDAQLRAAAVDKAIAAGFSFSGAAVAHEADAIYQYIKDGTLTATPGYDV